jgi:hypothetical protein
MPYEADAILSNLLLSDPDNIIARTMRMLILENIAHAQTDFHISELAFDRAVAEEEFIIRCCNFDDIIWCEMGILYYCRAKKYMHYLREDNAVNGHNINKEDVLKNFRKAKEYFIKGLAVSPTGKETSSVFYFMCTLGFIELISSGENIFDKREYPSLIDKHDVFRKVGIRFFYALGWLRNEVTAPGDRNELTFLILLIKLKDTIARYENSMLTKGYVPYIKYLFCIVLWDFAPYLTIGICKYILGALNEAIIKTEKLITENIFVYQASINFISTDKFISLIQAALDMINNYFTADDLKKDDGSLIDQDKFKELSKIKLILLEFDRCYI